MLAMVSPETLTREVVGLLGLLELGVRILCGKFATSDLVTLRVSRIQIILHPPDLDLEVVMRCAEYICARLEFLLKLLLVATILEASSVFVVYELKLSYH